MKTPILLCILIGLLTLTVSWANAQSAVGVGVRSHVLHTEFEEYPFDDGDISYVAGYEYHDKAGYWQLLVGYTPDVGDGTVVDSIITPQLNLLLQDGAWLAGVGILGSYVETTLETTDWTDVYWQVMLGFEIPLPIFKLELLAYYPFESWSTFGDFDTDDIEFGGLAKFMF
jgi:hypothetical protein